MRKLAMKGAKKVSTLGCDQITLRPLIRNSMRDGSLVWFLNPSAGAPRSDARRAPEGS